jgi:hypothetical protein
MQLHCHVQPLAPITHLSEMKVIIHTLISYSSNLNCCNTELPNITDY